MICPQLRHCKRAALALGVTAAGMILCPVIADEPTRDEGDHRMEVTSTTFTAGSTLPLSTIDSIIEDGVNTCSVNGAPGGDESPQLAWTYVPRNTRSFVVILYDPTAGFTHWGMYNISAHIRMLPQNAGVADSKFGAQIENDFGDLHYDGPCPPANVAPFAHHYVFTVYALDTALTLPSSVNFPADAETLYHALIHAGRDGHILASASLGAFYSSTPAD
jgi:Raf kinase inhibitor-like YbhB/YbcL family protein